MRCIVVTPEKTVVDEPAEFVALPLFDGEIGISPRHSPMIGRLGCGDCYEAFKKQLTPLLKRIHSADRHVGKVPLTVGKTVKDTRDLQDLRIRMEKAIQFEEFEEAARLRDQIKEMERKDKEG